MADPSLLGTLHVRTSEAEPVHTCSLCDFPIAIYGRLTPCNHLFCLECSKSLTTCPTCRENITKVNTVGYRSQVYVCLHPGCLKSYLSKFSLTEHQRLRNHHEVSSPEAQRAAAHPPPAPAPSVVKAPPAPSPIPSQNFYRPPPEQPSTGFGGHAPSSSLTPAASAAPTPLTAASLTPAVLQKLAEQLNAAGLTLPQDFTEQDVLQLVVALNIPV